MSDQCNGRCSLLAGAAVRTTVCIALTARVMGVELRLTMETSTIGNSEVLYRLNTSNELIFIIINRLCRQIDISGNGPARTLAARC
ncbi:hypothetical protein EVAR_36283_1 [Eumeta japonica]|uniref:Uncharacterized protein n=1 Tax=Eumeta variegata TaxID=151549 RepID=A0A4C1VIJ1_EUMVA|nr:hypothetical protein EVAR_36283_1 [Eumeta japonica]